MKTKSIFKVKLRGRKEKLLLVNTYKKCNVYLLFQTWI